MNNIYTVLNTAESMGYLTKEQVISLTEEWKHLKKEDLNIVPMRFLREHSTLREDQIALIITQVGSNSSKGKSTVSRFAYILLALFLGATGAHNIYAGRSIGFLQLFLFLFTGWFGGFLITGTWAFFEMLLVDTDGSGNKMI